ncbi:LPS O-antigen length regulator [Pseudoalteromonas rubra]|uniref:LPS O-antigen length regulator n=1 Tax=Pseudoalteromonas rubra TaxID=43658 RepID=A0A4Q7EDU1_9GAMM|nr:Wzz/FepE/Etk N-terminal domain-containing protein [Pseudoalteromonas rubra]RZM81157.1 LPS O-antigen length regulator [Pseudoalteromonas rubra]
MSQITKEDDIDLRELVKIIWEGKWTIVLLTTVFAIGAVLFSLSLPNVYKSHVLVAPADDESSGGLAGLTGQLGGMAGLAGLSLPGGNEKVDLAIEIMKSRRFISDFISEYELLPDLMAAKKWDKASNTLIYDESIYLAEQEKWVRDVKAPYSPQPSMQEAYVEFRDLLTITKEKEAGLIRITIEHVSPLIAKQWLELLVKSINSEMKLETIEEADKSMYYLNRQLRKTSIADIQSVLYALIEEQTKKKMFAEVREEYVFKTIDPAIVPELKSGPKRALICILITMLGFMVAFVIVALRYYLRKRG